MMPRGRPRGRPKTAGRGRGRGRACQTDGSASRRLSRSPPSTALKSGRDGGLHMTSTAHGFPLSPHPGAPPGIYPYGPPQSLQPPGLPHPPPQIHAQAGLTPRGSSHCKPSHQDDPASDRVSSSTQASWQNMHQSGFSSGRHSQDSVPSRHTSGSKQSGESPYTNNRQGPDHPYMAHRHAVDHQERPSARKAHRQPREFPFQEEFEPTYSGQKEKRFSSGGQRHDKDTFYNNQRVNIDKPVLGKYQEKDVSHRTQFQSMEPTYSKQRRDQNYGDQRPERDTYVNRRTERDQSYENQRQERDQRYLNSRHDRDHFQGSSRREKDSSYGMQRLEPQHRSSSAESSYSFGSQSTDRDTSPHFSPSRSAGFHQPGLQPYGRDSRNRSVERDSEYLKQRDSSGERRPSQHTAQFSTLVNSSRQPPENFVDSNGRYSQRDNTFSAPMCDVDSRLQTKNGCSGKSSKSNKFSGSHSSLVPDICDVPNQFNRCVSPYPDRSSQHCIPGQELQMDGRLSDDPFRKKPPDLQDNHARGSSFDRSTYEQSDRDRSSGRKKRSVSSRDRSANGNAPPLIHYSQQDSYLPPSPSITNDHSENVTLLNEHRSQEKGLSLSSDSDYNHFRIPRQSLQSQPQDTRPSRPRRPSTPSSSPSSPYSSRPPTPPLYTPRPHSPSSFPQHTRKQVSPKHQQFSKEDESPPRRWSPHLVGAANTECSDSTKQLAQTLSCPPTPQRIKHRNSKVQDSPEFEELPPPAEPMAWQQQYLKHLQKQQEQQLQEEQMQSEKQDPVHAEYITQKQQMQREDMHLQKTQEQMQRQQIQREQMRKQQEQMQKEYMKIQQEKMLREHMKQQEQLQGEHMVQLEEMRKQHIRQQQEQLQHDYMRHQESRQRDLFKQQQEKLLQDQVHQQEKLRHEQLRRQEAMQREHVKLQQEYMQQLKIQVHVQYEQEWLQREQVQNHHQQLQYQNQHRETDTENQNPQCQRQLPDYIQYRYQQIQQQQQQQEQEQQQQQYHQQPQKGSDYHENSKHYQQQPQAPTGKQQFHQPHHHHQLPQNHCEPKENQHQQYQQQQYRQNDPLHQPQQQDFQYQHQQRDSSLHLHHQQQYHEPVPPWQQNITSKDKSVRVSHETDVSPIRQESKSYSPARQPQTVSPARQPHHNSQTISPARQPCYGNQTSESVKQPHQSPVQQVSAAHLNSQSYAQMTNTSYNVMRQEQHSESQLNNAAQAPTTIQTRYQQQHHKGQGSKMPHQDSHNFAAHGASQMRPPLDKQVPKPKKPPWLQHQDTPVPGTQKKPPWQQHSEHMIFVTGQEVVVADASRFPGTASYTPGQQLSVQQQSPGISRTPTLHRMVTSSLQDQTQGHHQNNILTGVSHQQSLTDAQKQQNHNHQSAYDGSSQGYPQALHAHVPVAQLNSHCSQHAPSHSSVPSGGHQFLQHSNSQQRMPTTQAVDEPRPSSNMHIPPHHNAASHPSQSHVHVSQTLERPSNAMSSYQTSHGYSEIQEQQPIVIESTTDQECAQQVLVEALNEQTSLQSPDGGSTFELTQNVQTTDQNNVSVQMQPQNVLVNVADVPQQLSSDTSGVQTYTLHHLFDDANRLQPHIQSSHIVPTPPPLSTTGQMYPLQGSLQQPTGESSHQVIPGNPLDTAVAMLNFPESELDIPMIEQHQVFVLEPPSTVSHSRHQLSGSTLASATSVRRNSWHTPENSIVGSGSVSSADDDAALVIDLGTDLADDDDDIFSSQQPAPQSAHDLKASLKNSANVPADNVGINDLGLRISSVFSLATKRRKKRRTMSDSVLQEVEIVAQQEGFTEGPLVASPVVANGSNSLDNLSLDPSQAQNIPPILNPSDTEFTVFEDQKSVPALNSIPGFNNSSSDPLAELTKLLFSDGAVPSPGPTVVEDWNINEAAGVSFEADSVCVPGTPARGEPETLATPLPQLYTPMPQLGTPRPHCFKDPGTPFARHAPQYIKSPATPLSACARDIKEPLTPLSAKPFPSTCAKDIKEPVTPLPHPVKEHKEPGTPLPSCAMGPPAPFPSLVKKAKDMFPPLPQCAKGSTSPLQPHDRNTSVARCLGASGALKPQTIDSVLESRAEALENTISENVESTAKQPLEQAIRELLGDEPIGKVTKKSFVKINSKSMRRSCVKNLPKQPQRKSERISAKETKTTATELYVKKKLADTDKDVRSKVKDNWERRCAGKNAITSRSRDNSRESDKEKRCVQLNFEPTSGMRPYKPPPSTRSINKTMEVEEEDKKGCGVRGRRTMMIAGKRKLDKTSSTEDPSPERTLCQASSSSQSHKPWYHVMKSLSQDSSDSDCDTKTDHKNDSTQNKTEAQDADDFNQDVFFPSLSRSNSTDSSLAEDADNDIDKDKRADKDFEREKRRRLSSCKSMTSQLSSQDICEEEGEKMADIILPVVFPPSRRQHRNNQPVMGPVDVLVTFHEHKLRCVKLEGEYYVILEELLTKCFPGLPRADVERARMRDLNLLTHTVHLLGSGLSNDSGEPVSILAVSDASRLLHFFHGLMNCPGTDCKLSTFPCEHGDHKVAEDFNTVRHHEHCDDRGAQKPSALRSTSFDFIPPGSVKSNRSEKTPERRGSSDSAKGSHSEEDPVADGDAHDDIRSCTSDQTFPYCDGQPLISWEDESVAKGDENSDNMRDANPLLSSCNVNRKFRSHSSDSEGRIHKLKDKDGFHRIHSSFSPDVFSVGEASPMLPPLPTYIASPFTPNSMYNVPMDNERVLLECFSAPGSQAPSSVRSAPSVRLLSPDRSDLPHFDEDLFEGLSNHKAMPDLEVVNTRMELQSTLRSPHVNTSFSDMEQSEEHLADNEVRVNSVYQTESIDYHDHDFIDFEVEETDDVFLEDDIPQKEIKNNNTPCSQSLKDPVTSNQQATHKKELYLCKTTEAVKEQTWSAQNCSYEKPLPSQKTEVFANYATVVDPGFPLSIAQRQQLQKKEIESMKDNFQCSKNVGKEVQLAKYLDKRLCAIIAGEREACHGGKNLPKNNNSADNPETKSDIVATETLDDSYELSSLLSSTRSSVSEDISHPENSPLLLNPSSEEENLSSKDPALAIERKDSGTTIAYGASDEEVDVTSYTEESIQVGLESQGSTGPPDLSTVHGSVQTDNSPHTSPPRIECFTTEETLTAPKRNTKLVDSQPNVMEEDERRPPEGSDGSLEDRVQDFITHGSQFTPRAMVRSNSLPDLCGAETLASPVRDSKDSASHTPGPITSRSNSYPGVSGGEKFSCNGNSSDQSAVPSPAAPLLRKVSQSADAEKVEDSSESSACTSTHSPKSEEKHTENSSVGGSVHVPDLEEAVFLDSADVVDGGDIYMRATPRHKPHTGDDMGNQLFEWAVPCAAHGSVFCSCEGIDIQTAQDVPASPKVGPWLCTPGTPAPATPLCDYSKLIYSPFPVQAGMTPARPDTTEIPAGSPKLSLTPELDVLGCGMKRMTPPEDQPAAKRRPPTPASQAGAVSSVICDVAVAIDVSKCADDENGGQIIGRCSENIVSDVKDRKDDYWTNVLDGDKVQSQSEELELIAAAKDSERTMANLSSEKKLQFGISPTETCDSHNTLSLISDDRLLTMTANTKDNASTASCASDRLVAEVPAEHLTTADIEHRMDRPCLTLASDMKGSCPSSSTEPCRKSLADSNIENGAGGFPSQVNCERVKVCDSLSRASVNSAETNQHSLSDTYHKVDKREYSRAAEVDVKKIRTFDCVVVLTDILKDKAVLNNTSPSNVSDTSSTETSDGESVNDVRIITLRDDWETDMELTSFDSEDSRDSTEARLSPEVLESKLHQSSREDKKTRTVAQHEQIYKKSANNKEVKLSAVVSNMPKTDSKNKEMLTVSGFDVKRGQQGAEKHKTCNKTSDASTKEASILKPSTVRLDSRERVTLSKLKVTSGEAVPKVHRTESVPAESSRKMAVELKRSSSFHGQCPASKRVKREKDEGTHTTKPNFSRDQNTSDRKSQGPQTVTTACVASPKRSSHRKKSPDGTRDATSSPGLTSRVAEKKGEKNGEKSKKKDDDKRHDLKRREVSKNKDKRPETAKKEAIKITGTKEKRGIAKTEHTKTSNCDSSKNMRTFRTERTMDVDPKSEHTYLVSTQKHSAAESAEQSDRDSKLVRGDSQSGSVAASVTERTKLPKFSGCSYKTFAEDKRISTHDERESVSTEDAQMTISAQNVRSSTSTPEDKRVSTPSQPVEISTPMQNDGTSSPTQDVGMSNPAQDVRMSNPTQDVRMSSPTQDVRMSNPTQDVRMSSPTQGVRMSSPTQNVKMSSPTQDVRMSSPTQDVRMSSPTQDVRMSSPTQNVKMLSPTQDVRMSSPTQGVRTSNLKQGVRKSNPTQDLRTSILTREEEHEEVQNIRMSTPTQDERLPSPAHDKGTTSHVKDSGVLLSKHDKRASSPTLGKQISSSTRTNRTSTSTQKERAPKSTQDETISILTTDGKMPIPSQTQILSNSTVDERTLIPVQTESGLNSAVEELVSGTSTPTQDEHMPLDFEDQLADSLAKSHTTSDEQSDNSDSESVEFSPSDPNERSSARIRFVWDVHRYHDRQAAAAPAKIAETEPNTGKGDNSQNFTVISPADGKKEEGDIAMTDSIKEGQKESGTDPQLSGQLAALLKEKENMLEEFRKRAMELERTVKDLRVELQETKKKGDEPEPTQGSSQSEKE